MKKTYSELLKSPKWQKKRLEIMSRDKFTCKKCGDTVIMNGFLVLSLMRMK
jgi:5-methylcytosine-specific restriction endonuclease McrA